jgi:hypothetical protein
LQEFGLKKAHFLHFSIHNSQFSIYNRVGVRVTVGVSVGVGVGGSVENEILQCLSGFQKILGWVLRKKINNVEEQAARRRGTA